MRSLVGQDPQKVWERHLQRNEVKVMLSPSIAQMVEVRRLRRPSLQNPTMEGVTGSMAAGMTVGAGVGPEASPEAEAEHEAAAEVGHQQGLLDGKGNTHHKRKAMNFLLASYHIVVKNMK
jgi:hypothetical protein